MSGVPGDIPPPDRAPAAVFDLTSRLPAPSVPSRSQLVLAETVQGLFLFRGQSLADPATAAAYRVSLEAVNLLLEGALATGALPEVQHATLRDLVDAAATVPDIL
jgi:hypothetical protein